MRISDVSEGGQAQSQGVRIGDKIVEIDGNQVRDHLDLIYYATEETFVLTLHRGSYELRVKIDNTIDYGFDLEPMEYQHCGNNCVFCFVDQNKPGMREGICFKDEDYRLSFLEGSYVTLTRLSELEMDRIAAQHLSPLYVSIHATDLATRMTLLGLKKDDHLLDKLDRLITAGISFHTQIVVCPGINDGAILKDTIIQLRRRFPAVLSVAVVPVGLTKHREGLFPLTAVDTHSAESTIALVNDMHKEYSRETGDGFVYCADEWYLDAGRAIPPIEYYGDFPQIENGVGMLRDFIDASAEIDTKLQKSLNYRHGRFVLLTGVSMGNYIEKLAVRLSEVPGIEARSLTVANDFFGGTVTVSGLLTGRDIAQALEGVSPDETVVLPPNCLNSDGVFLDDVKPEDIADSLNIKIVKGAYDPVSVFLPGADTV